MRRFVKSYKALETGASTWRMSISISSLRFVRCPGRRQCDDFAFSAGPHFRRLMLGHEREEFLLGERLPLEQCSGATVEDRTPYFQESQSAVECTVDNRLYSFVDLARGRLAIGSFAQCEPCRRAEKARLVALISDMAEFSYHAVTRRDASRDVGDLLEIISGASGELIEYKRFGRAAAHEYRHLVLEFPARHQEPILGRALDRVTKGANPA